MSTVAAVVNQRHDRASLAAAVRALAATITPPLPTIVKRGDRVLLKVNMGCKGLRAPKERFTSHPAYVEAIIECLLDCGAQVVFGDDVSRTNTYDRIWERTGMRDVAKRTGASLVDFTAAGGREARGFLRFPRTYLVTNLVFEADVIANAASCRSHAGVVLSGAIKNMFGVVLGARRHRLHSLFPNKRAFSRVLVDICRVARPRVSFLDLTTVVEGHGVAPSIQPVGLVLGGTDPVAVDTVAAHAVGYEDLTLWTGVYGHEAGLGNNAMDRITVAGADPVRFPVRRLRRPDLRDLEYAEPFVDRVSRLANNTLLRPRPTIDVAACTGCGDCATRCPVDAIRPEPSGRYAIDRQRCADCGCCLKVCDAKAVRLEFGRLTRVARALTFASPSVTAGSASR